MEAIAPPMERLTMRVVLMCATRRGFKCLEKLVTLLPDATLTVFSFPEEPWEPPYLEDVKRLTHEHGNQFIEARDVAQDRLSSFWEHTKVDLMIAVNWPHFIPALIYVRADLGAFAFHDSLLPKYRGYSPTVWSMINGEAFAGVTLFHMVEEKDAGDIVDQLPVPIHKDSTISYIMEQVTEKYLQLLERNMSKLLSGNAPRIPQMHSEATYTCKRLPDDNKINWNSPTSDIYNLIRATTFPYSGAFTILEKHKLRIWSASLYPQSPYVGSIPGRVVQVFPGEGSVVLTQDGALYLRDVQFEGKEIRCAADILNNVSLTLTS
jgi:methionyl-tRNA formyltransferase